MALVPASRAQRFKGRIRHHLVHAADKHSQTSPVASSSQSQRVKQDSVDQHSLPSLEHGVRSARIQLVSPSAAGEQIAFGTGLESEGQASAKPSSPHPRGVTTPVVESQQCVSARAQLSGAHSSRFIDPSGQRQPSAAQTGAVGLPKGTPQSKTHTGVNVSAQALTPATPGAPPVTAVLPLPPAAALPPIAGAEPPPACPLTACSPSFAAPLAASAVAPPLSISARGGSCLDSPHAATNGTTAPAKTAGGRTYRHGFRRSSSGTECKIA